MDVLLENVPWMVPATLSPREELEKLNSAEVNQQCVDQIWNELHQCSHGTLLLSRLFSFIADIQGGVKNFCGQLEGFVEHL